MLLKFSLENIPIWLAIIFVIGLITTYTTSVSLGHVYFWFPMISDTTAEQPESGIFGSIAHSCSILIAVVIYLRYQQIQLIKQHYDLNITPFWNKLARFCGYVFAFGVNMVGNFSELELLGVHMVSAVLCFSSGVLYVFIQTKFSYNLLNHNSKFALPKKLFLFRVGICIVLAVSFLLTLIFSIKANDAFTGDKLNYWKEKDGGFTYRLISTFSEWITALGLLIFIVTLRWEFVKMKCKGIHVEFKDK